VIRVVGAISPLHNRFAAKGATITQEILDKFPGDRVVLFSSAIRATCSTVSSPASISRTLAAAVASAFVPAFH